MRLIFLGSPPFAEPVLESVLESSHRVLALVTPPDRPSGRGLRVARSPLAAAAERHGIDVLRPATTKSAEFVQALAARAPDVLLVASYGEILREDVLALAPHGAINVHASLLPRWRGASPIQAAILAGDEWTGVTIQRMVRALDAGDVMLSERTRIEPEETAGEVAGRLAVLGGEAAVRALDLLESGEARFTPQDPAAVTRAGKLTKESGRIDWSADAPRIARLVRAMNPWPLARTTLEDGREFAVHRARPLEQPSPPDAGAGAVLDPARFLVSTGHGVLELLTVQPAGRPAMDASAFLRGARLSVSTRLR